MLRRRRRRISSVSAARTTNKKKPAATQRNWRIDLRISFKRSASTRSFWPNRSGVLCVVYVCYSSFPGHTQQHRQSQHITKTTKSAYARLVNIHHRFCRKRVLMNTIYILSSLLPNINHYFFLFFPPLLLASTLVEWLRFCSEYWNSSPSTILLLQSAVEYWRIFSAVVILTVYLDHKEKLSMLLWTHEE